MIEQAEKQDVRKSENRVLTSQDVSGLDAPKQLHRARVEQAVEGFFSASKRQKKSSESQVKPKNVLFDIKTRQNA